MSIKDESYFSSSSSHITISTKILGSLISPRDLRAHQLDRLILHVLWQCGRAENFLLQSFIRSYKHKDGVKIHVTMF